MRVDVEKAANHAFLIPTGWCLILKNYNRAPRIRNKSTGCITTNPESIILSHTLADAQDTWI
jgi:hypothetical protein